MKPTLCATEALKPIIILAVSSTKTTNGRKSETKNKDVNIYTHTVLTVLKEFWRYGCNTTLVISRKRQLKQLTK